MSDFEDIQRLIRLKRHEQPPQDFVEDFVGRLQHRQRAELLQQSARGLLWERINTYFEGLFAPKWGFAGATVMALVAVFFVFKPAANSDRGGFEVSKVDMAEGVDPISQEEVSRYLTLQRQLMSRHYQGGFGDERHSGLADQDNSYILPPLPAQDGLMHTGLQLDVDLK